MKPSTGTLFWAAVIVGLGASIGCDSATPTAKPSATTPSSNSLTQTSNESVTFFVEGMI